MLFLKGLNSNADIKGVPRNLVLYPDGDQNGKGNTISIFLDIESSIPSDTKWVVKYILRAEGQKNGEHIEFEGNELFASNNASWGCAEFLSLAKLKDPKKGHYKKI
ncbi:hypothetical protein JRO89_XS09G0196200 [Xanthoceras sorbifolium]|uniref:MATH domain-containing protein n=1 Tax=Xanthoceras sorbifolium TaxID=99658 RepID=A0ABQ8HM76_9ROSI|nr:hypothetical protein JRO89_XS09G0196200 [Xanthoceras sorbifolium]